MASETRWNRDGVPYAPDYSADYSGPDAYRSAAPDGVVHLIVFRDDLSWDVSRDGGRVELFSDGGWCTLGPGSPVRIYGNAHTGRGWREATVRDIVAAVAKQRAE